MQPAADLGIRALILERDAHTVIESFGCNSNDLSHNGLILIEVCRLALGFNYFKAQYAPKCYNSLARLAKLAQTKKKKDWLN